MNIEQKAKAYDEALEKARMYRDNAKAVEYYAAVARYENIFPQLRESEDERIRKFLIWIVNNVLDNIRGLNLSVEQTHQLINDFSGIKNSDIIAYLEKQKDKNPATIEQVYGKFLSSDTLRSAKENKYIRTQLLWELMHNGIITEVDYLYLADANRKPWSQEEYQNAYKKGFDASEQLKQKEQKPAEWDEYTKINLDRALQIIKKAKGTLQGYQTDDGIYECDKAIECLEHFLYRGLEIEKPAEWSEDIIQKAVKEVGLTQRQIDWFKTNVFPPKPEWSEEDERIREALYKHFSVIYPGDSKFRDTKLSNRQITDFLKSIRPSWKPSEEEIEAVRYFVNKHQSEAWAATGQWKQFTALRGLLGNLMKLM